ncbi:MAG TPA: hypothetical protein VIF40_07855 [Methylosinus sp.]|uniref:hypothetical protein n=1 Tax=Methylosinus sp. TaxID=427 RepID=UPI002F920ECA
MFYFFWIGLYVAINFVWDWRSPHTPPFHIAHISEKLSVLYNASTFASSVLLISSVFNAEVQKVAGDAVAPIVMAALSGFMVGLAGLSPYKPERTQVSNQIGAGGYVVTPPPGSNISPSVIVPDTQTPPI